MKKDKLSKGAREVAAARARIRTYSPAKKKALEKEAMELINGGDAAKRCMKGLRRKLKKAMADVPVAQGWQCPCCQTVYAPEIKQCGCARRMTPKPMEVTEEMRRLYEEQFKARREERERLPVPYWPMTLPWWHPNHPFQVTCGL